jgi:ABC-type glycerol-3-phosphate transport system permease component
MIMPFLTMVGNAFKFDTEIAARPLSIVPREPTLYNFRVLFDRIPFWRQFLNSTLVATAATLSSTFVSAMVAYGFARFEFRGKRALFLIVIATILIPPQVLIVPQFRMFVSFR